jgi:hypothetical protein
VVARHSPTAHKSYDTADPGQHEEDGKRQHAASKSKEIMKGKKGQRKTRVLKKKI